MFVVTTKKMVVKIFTFRIPDGNINGEGELESEPSSNLPGFKLTGEQSLMKCFSSGKRIRQLRLRSDCLDRRETHDYEKGDDVYEMHHKIQSQRHISAPTREAREHKNNHKIHFTSNTFTFDDLTAIVSKIITKESHETGVDLNSLVLNSTHPERGEHSDHRMVGCLTVDIAKVLQWLPHSNLIP